MLFFPRFIRKRFVLALIFFTSLLYFILKTGLLHMLIEFTRTSEDYELEMQKVNAHRKIQWYNEKDDINETDKDIPMTKTCRNTVQGQHLVTDNRGYTCKRKNLLRNGCCDLFSLPTPSRFSCLSCVSQISCCSSYEYCVSCCVRPEQRSLLENVVRESTGRRLRLFLAASNQFELCLHKCRTSSHSVHQENKYKNAKMKHCYGLEPKLPFDERRK